MDNFFSVVEIATGNYGPYNVHLIEKMRNGLNESYRVNACNSVHNPSSEVELFEKLDSQEQQNSEMDDYERNGIFATSFARQWFLLTLRTIRCYSRDRTLTLTMRPVLHFLIALMIGTLYYNIGDDASMMFDNYRYVFMTLIFLMYTAFSSMTVLCKFEFDFNWIVKQTRSSHNNNNYLNLSISPSWNANFGKGAFQSLVFGKSLLLCFDIYRLAIAVYLCIDICIDYIFYDGSTAWTVSISIHFDHCVWVDTNLARHWNDTWCCVRCYCKYYYHHIFGEIFLLFYNILNL